MKNKILTFIIGVLVGAIIATLAFYCYSKNNTKEGFTPGERPSMSDQNGNGGTPPDMPNGGNGSGSQDGSSVPEKPDGDNSQKTETNSTTTDTEESNS